MTREAGCGILFVMFYLWWKLRRVEPYHSNLHNEAGKWCTFNFEEKDEANDSTCATNSSHQECSTWAPAKEIYKTQEHVQYLDSKLVAHKFVYGQYEILCISPVLNSADEAGVQEAVSQHSDLIPSKYEGGFKVWECTQDLANYLIKDVFHSLNDNNTVLDLGCGAGILGILALIHGCTVHFQDYNISVVNLFTIPNALMNINNAKDLINKECRFFAGDWLSFLELIQADDILYDVIVTSETIYNTINYYKLLAVFKKKLKKTGDIYVAAKVCYFGVGGSLQQFENFVSEDGTFVCSYCWSSQEGVQRKILHLKFRAP